MLIGFWGQGSYEVSHFCMGLGIVHLHEGEYLLLNIITARATSSIAFCLFPEQAFIPHWTILNRCRSCFHPYFVLVVLVEISRILPPPQRLAA